MRSTRGLVAPQNTLLETIVRNSSHGQSDYFLLANARILDHPIVYCSEGFTKLTGYGQHEVLQKNAICRFMYGPWTTDESKVAMEEAINSLERGRFTMILYRKNILYVLVEIGGPLCLMLHICPVRNSDGDIVLIFVLFQDLGSIQSASNLKTNLDGFGVGNEPSIKRGHPIFASLRNFLSFKKNNKIVPIGTFLDEFTPQYRVEPPKTLPQIFLHYSLFRNIWEWIILGLTLSSAILVPFSASFPVGVPSDDLVSLVINGTMDVFFFVDVVLNFHTTFVGDSGEVISRPGEIRTRYLRTWFAADLVSSLPYDVLYSIPALNHSSGHGLKFLRLFRLARISRMAGKYAEYRQALLVLLVFAFLLVSHWFACIWFAIGYHETVVLMDVNNWLFKLSQDVDQRFKVTYQRDGLETTVDISYWMLMMRSNKSMQEIKEFAITGGPSNSMCYFTSLYFVLSSLTSVGFGNVAATTVLEKFMCSLMMIFGAILYASIFGNVTTVFQQLYTSTGMYHEMLNSIKDFMRNNEIPVSLKERVLDYVVSTWTVNKGVDQNKVLGYCPNDMRADICIHLNRKVLEENPAFRLASEGCLRALAVHLTMMHSAPGDVICHQGEGLNVICFVASGSLEVVQDDEIIAILGPGDVFGDPCFRGVTAQCSASVTCLTYCDLHVITREDLTKILDFHQAFSQSFSRNLIFTSNLRTRFIFRKIRDVNKERELQERDKEKEGEEGEEEGEEEKKQQFHHHQPLRMLLASKLRRRRSSTSHQQALNNHRGHQQTPARLSGLSFRQNIINPPCNPPCNPGARNSLGLLQLDEFNTLVEAERSDEATFDSDSKLVKKTTNHEMERAMQWAEKEGRKVNIDGVCGGGGKGGEALGSPLKSPLGLADRRELLQVLAKLKEEVKDNRESMTRRMMEVEANIDHVMSVLLVSVGGRDKFGADEANETANDDDGSKEEEEEMKKKKKEKEILSLVNQDLDLL